MRPSGITNTTIRRALKVVISPIPELHPMQEELNTTHRVRKVKTTITEVLTTIREEAKTMKQQNRTLLEDVEQSQRTVLRFLQDKELLAKMQSKAKWTHSMTFSSFGALYPATSFTQCTKARASGEYDH